MITRADWTRKGESKPVSFFETEPQLLESGFWAPKRTVLGRLLKRDYGVDVFEFESVTINPAMDEADFVIDFPDGNPGRRSCKKAFLYQRKPYR